MQMHSAADEGCNLIRQHLELDREIMLAVWQCPARQLVSCSRGVPFCGNEFKREGLDKPSTPTPRGTSLSPQAVSQACGKEGEAQEGSSWLQLLRPGVVGHTEQKLSQQERTTTIRKRGSVYQAVEGEKWQLATIVWMMPASSKESNIRRRHLEGRCRRLSFWKMGCRMNVVGRWKIRPRATEKRKRVLSGDGEILKTPQR